MTTASIRKSPASDRQPGRRFLCWATAAWLVLPGCPAERAGLNPAGETGAGEPGALGEVKVLEMLLQENGDRGAAIRNSRVTVNSGGITLLRQEGLRAMPALVALLRHDELSFDTFVRCYSAADQILEDAKADVRIEWGGGAEIVGFPDKGYRFEPFGQMDVPAFRRKVAAQAAEAWKEFQRKNAR